MARPRFAFAHLYAVFVMALAAAPLRADVVDDLLAGKAVDVSSIEAQEEPNPAPPASRIVLSDEAREVADHAEPLTVKVPSATIAQEVTSERFMAGPPAPISLVPEPSAIALASLALGYFFVFFRRRYA